MVPSDTIMYSLGVMKEEFSTRLAVGIKSRLA